ncbi:hypothetical protein V6N13_088579 [Hibiscus sabdariffa]
MASTGAGLGGSRFVVLSEAEGASMGPSGDKDGATVSGLLQHAPAATRMDGSVSESPVAPVGATDVRRASDGVVLSENVVGTHAAVSILDAANEKRRQLLATNGGKQPIARKNSGAGD